MIRNRVIKYIYVATLLLFSGFLFYLVKTKGFDLNQTQSLFSIIGSSSILVAILTYFKKNRQDELLATIDQITFFREKIIPKCGELRNVITKANPAFILSRIELDQPDIEYVRKNYSVNFNRQLEIFFNSSKNYPDLWMDPVILDSHILFLNMLEELSLKVINLKTDDNLALQSIHPAFIEMVEQNAVALLFMRHVKSGNNIYSATLQLYKSWKKDVIKQNFLKNLEKFELISKKQKDEIYKLRKKTLGF